MPEKNELPERRSLQKDSPKHDTTTGAVSKIRSPCDFKAVISTCRGCLTQTVWADTQRVRHCGNKKPLGLHLPRGLKEGALMKKSFL